MKAFLGILVGLGAFIGMIVWFFFSFTNGITDAADAVVAQLRSGNIEEVYQNSLLTQELTLEQFKTAMGVGGELDITQAEHKEWIGRGFKNQERYIYGDFAFPNGEVHNRTFWFLEIEEELKLLGITYSRPEVTTNTDKEEATLEESTEETETTEPQE